MNFRAFFIFIPALFSVLSGVGCSSGGSSNATTSTAGSSKVAGSPDGNANIVVSNAGSAPGTASEATGVSNSPQKNSEAVRDPGLGGTCKTGDSNHLCLGLKYVVYQNSSNKAVVSQPDLVKTVDGISDVWKQCDIGFQLDQVVSAQPPSGTLKYNPANMIEMDDIRKVYGDSNSLLVVTTGKWDRSGSLGNTGANAWTSMPGELLAGVILESTVGTFVNIIAHELGHYLNLDHVSDDTDLMNPIIGDKSKALTRQQCSEARAAVNSEWQRMIR